MKCVPVSVLLAFGANLPSAVGGPATTIAMALERIKGEKSVCLTAVSPAYATPAWPPSEQPDFVNLVAQVETVLPPEALLTVLHGTEAAFGRVRDVRWAARSLDIDILSYGDAVLPDPAIWQAAAGDAPGALPRAPLVLPHPALHKRDFVLRPLCDIAADWCHPVLRLTAAQMLNRVDHGGNNRYEKVVLPAL